MDNVQPALRPSVTWFAQEMETVLQANDHKGGWEDCTLPYLTERLIQETGELVVALMEDDPAVFDVVKECADIANFAMMIAENYAKQVLNKSGV